MNILTMSLAVKTEADGTVEVVVAVVTDVVVAKANCHSNYHK